MQDRPLPPELAHFSHLPDLQYRGAGEWSSACPACGGGGHRFDKSDRLRLFAADGKGNARIWCRQCGLFEWADRDTKLRPSPEAIQQAQELRIQYAENEAKRLRAKIAELQERAYWKGYHDAMKDPHRELWRKAGIPDGWQDYWQLGFTSQYSPSIQSPAMTIPYFAPGWEATTIQYRLTSPPEPNDKYRFQAGLKAGVWLAEPDCKPKGATLLMEGMKKAAVTFIETVAKDNGRFCVVAIPSKTPGNEMLQALEDCDPIYVTLDPDAYQPTRASNGKLLPAAVNRIADVLGKRVRFVRLPAKADDMFLDYDISIDLFMNYIKQATKTI